MSKIFKEGDRVSHKQNGVGNIILNRGDTVIVQFEHGIESCATDALVRLTSLEEDIMAAQWHNPQELSARVLSLAIRSVNDVWGIFSLARIQLLPHQLWVCRRVLQEMPARWLVADDVGLGKTIEAGLILLPLLTRNIVKRVLILCPASLVDQWQFRMWKMFDIRLTRYTTEADTSKSSFWETNDCVIASVPTLRKDHQGRHKRLFDAATWDLLIVDEAHHLNADENTGPTLGYRLVDRLINEYEKVHSAVFFSGTPHRGKNYEFFSLMHLLRADLFDPNRDLRAQMPSLRQAMLRNNKQTVTDMHGKLLFRPVSVRSETYSYSSEETAFYEKLTQFILTGKAYASSLTSQQDQRIVMLVLICMQKLASSSVAAIRKALKNRLERLDTKRQKLENVEERYKDILSKLDGDDEDSDEDELNILRESIFELKETVRLMIDERPQLEELVVAADTVIEETKIQAILNTLETRFRDRQVLFFTEYKATQALLMSALMRRYGDDCVTFINGDEALEGVIDSTGKVRSFREVRSATAEKFNEGRVRFLISTEAGGEGIDLQQSCYSLVHVDLPWNPMRLHQRVGRLNRYGQKHAVEVTSLRNPDTVETRIWDKLNAKIETITDALCEVMEEPEDLLQLVLGMTSPKLFTELFSDASKNSSGLGNWFDQKTATFGGMDAIATVRDLVGSVDKFDFQQVSSLLPKVDLPDLKPFFITMLQLNHKRIHQNERGELDFQSPKSWEKDPAIFSRYEEVAFDRSSKSKHIMGVGHKLFDFAIQEASELRCSVAIVSSLSQPLFVFQIRDRVTDTRVGVKQIIAGLELYSEAKGLLLRDWQLLEKLNSCLSRNENIYEFRGEHTVVMQQLDLAQRILASDLGSLGLPFQKPDLEAIAVFYPDQTLQVELFRSD